MEGSAFSPLLPFLCSRAPESWGGPRVLGRPPLGSPLCPSQGEGQARGTVCALRKLVDDCGDHTSVLECELSSVTLVWLWL